MTSEVLTIHQMSEMVEARTSTVKTCLDAGVHERGGRWHTGEWNRPFARCAPADEQASDAALSPSDVIGVNR